VATGSKPIKTRQKNGGLAAPIWPFDYLPEVAAGVQPHVRKMLEAVLAFVET
jgi:N-formylglutamate deformylase